MLNQTKKSTNRLRSAKLPKLNIQQQIDNQEVAERMNRKINFSKNPRHLAQTMSYAQAFSTTEISQNKFRVEPEELFFSHYNPNHTYECDLKLVNHSRYIQRIKITPLKHKEFALTNIRYPNQNSGDVAPGMAVTLSVRFRPPSLNDFEDQLLLIAGDGVIRVPIVAQRQRCQINWPKSIECGHCWVGDVIRKEVVLKNRGGDACFSLVGGEECPSALKVGYFKVAQTKLNFQAHMQLRLDIQFMPQKKGSFKQTIKFKTLEGDQEQVQIALEGGAYSAQIVLEELCGEKMLQPKVNNELCIQNTQMGKQSLTSLKIRNLALVQVDYFWHYQAAHISVDKKMGKIKPSELLDFRIAVTPQQIVPETTRLELYLYNLPQKSITGNVVAKKIDGKEAIQCLSIDVKTKPVLSQVTVYPLFRKIVQPLYQNHAVDEWIKVVNDSSVCRRFKIDLICQDQGLLTACSQTEGVLEPKCQKEIKVSFNLTTLTRTDKRASFLISFDNGKSQIFSLQGQSTYPQLHYSQQLLYYGLLKTYTINKKKLTVKNPQKTSVEVNIVNHHRFYTLDFYEFYQFQDQNSYKKKFNIYNPHTGQQMIQPFTIPPQSQIQLDCYMNVMGPEPVEIEVVFDVKNGQKTPVRIVGEVQDVIMSLNRTSINMRQIYKGNVYNSNKFLAKELRITNDGHHDCAFSIVDPSFDQCGIKIRPLKGIIKKNQYQRIDLLIEPIKTGDFDFNIQWQYFDDFKMNPDLYPEMSDSISFNKEDGTKSLVKDNKLKISGVIKGMAMNYYLKDQAKAKKVKVKLQDGSQSIKLSSTSFQSSLKSTQKLHQNQKLVYPTLEELHFYNCEINQVRQVQIIIENDSGLSTQYQIYAQNYHTDQKPSNLQKRTPRGLIKAEDQPFTSEMGQTFIRNRALDRSQKIHLGNNKGISVLCEPASGTLHKKQNQKVMITMFNDTSGRFKDNLLICVKNHQTKKIPIDIHIKGTPVALSRNQLGIDFNQEIPLMHLGTILHSNGLVKKSIKVVNNGPKEVELKWLVYPHNKVDPNKDIFNIQLEDAAPGTGNLVELKWNALKPHVDKQANFSIQPKEKKLKGRQEHTFTVFIQQIKNVGQFANLLICQPTLVDGNKKTPMEELAVVVKTLTIQPQLTMDVQHNNHINILQKFAFPHEEFQTNTNNFQRMIKLKNNLKTNLTFDLSIINKDQNYDCFKLVQTQTNSPATLFASTSKQIQTSFAVTHGSILEAKVELCGNPNNTTLWPMEQKIRKEGQLVLSYSNGEKQVIQLVGWLYRPWVQIEMPNNQLHSSQNFQIDFGTVHIKNSKKESVYLINPSKVDGKWSIAYIKYHQSIKYKFQQSLWTKLDYEDQTIQDEKKCWRLSSDGGIVKNKTIPIHYMPNTLALPGQDDRYAQTHKPVQLQIMFKPEANLLYKSKFRVTVVEGLTFDIVVKGRGTYEEEQEKK